MRSFQTIFSSTFWQACLHTTKLIIKGGPNFVLHASGRIYRSMVNYIILCKIFYRVCSFHLWWTTLLCCYMLHLSSPLFHHVQKSNVFIGLFCSRPRGPVNENNFEHQWFLLPSGQPLSSQVVIWILRQSKSPKAVAHSGAYPLAHSQNTENTSRLLSWLRWLIFFQGDCVVCQDSKIKEVSKANVAKMPLYWFQRLNCGTIVSHFLMAKREISIHKCTRLDLLIFFQSYEHGTAKQEKCEAWNHRTIFWWTQRVGVNDNLIGRPGFAAVSVRKGIIYIDVSFSHPPLIFYLLENKHAPARN